jgi:hypothetical protein
MAIVNTIPKLISAKILKTLENDLVAKKICTMDTSTPIAKQGDTVYFPGLTDPTIAAYTGTLTYEDLEDATVALLIDQKNSYAFKVDDIEAFQSIIDVKGSSVERAAYGLKNVADTYVLGLYAGAGNTTSATVTSATALSTVSTAVRMLEENNVPGGQRWLVVPPWFAEKMRLAGVAFSINNGIDGGKGGLSWVNYLDTDIYISNNIVTTGSNPTYVSKCMAGSYNSIVYADQILKSRFIAELEGSFAGGASGLHVFGAKVLKPKELVVITATQAAETQI